MRNQHPEQLPTPHLKSFPFIVEADEIQINHQELFDAKAPRSGELLEKPTAYDLNVKNIEDNLFDEEQGLAHTRLFDHIIENLATRGYSMIENAFDSRFIENIQQLLYAQNESEFQSAKIGRQTETQLNSTIRRDKILWINENLDTGSNSWITCMENLRVALNQSLYLGLQSYECHFAQYNKGDFYSKHLDAFKSTQHQSNSTTPLKLSNRVLSTVLYLNKDWSAQDGGELILYPPLIENHHGQLPPQLPVSPITIRPSLGTFVVFLSELFPHEVLPSQRSRSSIAGWFRDLELR